MQKMFKSVNVQKIFYETAPFLVKNRTPDVLVQINVPDSFYKPLPKFMLTANSRISFIAMLHFILFANLRNILTSY